MEPELGLPPMRTRLCRGVIAAAFSVLVLFPPAQIRKTETLKTETPEASAVDSQSRCLKLWLLVRLADWGSCPFPGAPASPGVQPGARSSSLSPRGSPRALLALPGVATFALNDFPSPVLHIQLPLCPRCLDRSALPYVYQRSFPFKHTNLSNVLCWSFTVMPLQPPPGMPPHLTYFRSLCLDFRHLSQPHRACFAPSGTRRYICRRNEFIA